MSWTELEPVMKTVSNCRASIRVVSSGPKITFSFSEPFFRELGSPKKVSLLAHPVEAKMLLKVSKEGKFAVVEFGQGGGRVTRIPVPPWAPNTDREAERCETEKTPEGWVIKLPMAAWHNQAVKPVEEPKFKGAMVPPAPAKTKTDDLVAYLRKKGWKCTKLSPSRFTLDGSTATINEILARVNSERAEAHLAPLMLDDIE